MTCIVVVVPTEQKRYLQKAEGTKHEAMFLEAPFMPFYFVRVFEIAQSLATILEELRLPGRWRGRRRGRRRVSN